MPEAMTSAGAPAQAPSGEIVRGNGNAPGQNPGEAMPDIPGGIQRASLSTFKQTIAARAAAKQQQPPAARGRVAQFSAEIEAKQQKPVEPNAARGQEGRQATKTEPMGDRNQLSELGDPRTNDGQIELDDSQQAELVTEAGELETAGDALTELEMLNRFREWADNDMFPEELEDKLHEVKARGVTRYVDTKELRQGYVRGVDYRQQGEHVKQVEQKHNGYVQRMQQHFEQIRDPAQMLEIYERNGYSDTLYAMAGLIAERDRHERGIVRAAGLDVMQRRGINDPNHREVVDAMKRAEQDVKEMRLAKIEARKNAFDRAQIEAEKKAAVSQQKTQEHYAVYENQLNQLRPLVFRAYGVPDNRANRAALMRHLNAVVNEVGVGPEGLTKDILMKAGQDLAEERESERAAGGTPMGLSPEQWQRIQAQKAQQRPNTAGSRALQPGRVGMGGGRPMAANGQPARGRISDLKAMIQKGRMG